MTSLPVIGESDVDYVSALLCHPLVPEDGNPLWPALPESPVPPSTGDFIRSLWVEVTTGSHPPTLQRTILADIMARAIQRARVGGHASSNEEEFAKLMHAHLSLLHAVSTWVTGDAGPVEEFVVAAVTKTRIAWVSLSDRPAFLQIVDPTSSPPSTPLHVLLDRRMLPVPEQCRLWQSFFVRELNREELIAFRDILATTGNDNPNKPSWLAAYRARVQEMHQESSRRKSMDAGALWRQGAEVRGGGGSASAAGSGAGSGSTGSGSTDSGAGSDGSSTDSDGSGAGSGADSDDDSGVSPVTVDEVITHHDAALFFDNESRHIEQVKMSCPRQNVRAILVSVTQHEPAVTEFWESHYLQNLAKGTTYLVSMLGYFPNMLKFKVDPGSGLKDADMDTCREWVLDQQGTHKRRNVAVLFDWDRTLTVFEGVNLQPWDFSLDKKEFLDKKKETPMLRFVSSKVRSDNDKLPLALELLEQYVTLVCGGKERIGKLRDLFAFLVEHDVYIYVLTNNTGCNRYAFEMLAHQLFTGIPITILCGMFSKYHKGRALEGTPQFSKLCGAHIGLEVFDDDDGSSVTSYSSSDTDPDTDDEKK